MARPIPIRIGRSLYPSRNQAQDAMREELKSKVTDADGHWLWGLEFRSPKLSALLRNYHPDIIALGIDPQIFRVEPPLPGQERSGYQLLVRVPEAPNAWVTVGWTTALRPSAQRLYTQLNHALRRATMEWVDGERAQNCLWCGSSEGIEIHHESPSFHELYSELWSQTARDTNFQSLLNWSRLSAFWAGEPWALDDLWSHPLLQEFKERHDAGLRLPLCHSCHVIANAAQRDRILDRRNADQSSTA